jgi:hypothetical protein
VILRFATLYDKLSSTFDGFIFVVVIKLYTRLR